MLLLTHHAVKEVVVLTREDQPDDPRLVAYVVPAGQPAPTASDLRQHLMARLLDYMIPSVYVLLDALPLTANGKIDRRALPAPDRRRPTLTTPFTLPRTPVEAALTEMWVEVLGIEQVGIHDNFLDLGGDSLLAAQLAARVHDTLQVHMPLRALLESPTVAAMAVTIVEYLVAHTEAENVSRLLSQAEGSTNSCPATPREHKKGLN